MRSELSLALDVFLCVSDVIIVHHNTAQEADLSEKTDPLTEQHRKYKNITIHTSGIDPGSETNP